MRMCSRVGLSGGVLTYWVAVGNSHMWLFAALMLNAVWQSPRARILPCSPRSHPP